MSRDGTANKTKVQWYNFDKLKDSIKQANGNSLQQKSEDNKSLNKESEFSFDNCKCCGNVLTYPSEATKFRCSMCHTTIILSDLPKVKDHPHRLSYRYLKKILDSCVKPSKDLNETQEKKSAHEVFEPLSTYLLSAFRSIQCLNKSFRLDKNDKRLHFSRSNLNLEEIRACFILLSRLPTKRPLYNALLGASETLRRVYISLTDKASHIFFILILLEIPFLNKALIDVDKKEPMSMINTPEIRSLCCDITERIFGLLGNMNNSTVSNYISSWFSNLSSEEFYNKTELVNLYITNHLKRYYYSANNNVNRNIINNPASRLERELLHPEATDTSPQKVDDEVNIFGVDLPLIGRSRSRMKGSRKGGDIKIKVHQYGENWKIKSACVVMGLFVKANSIRKEKVYVSCFYNSLVDYVNMKLDFDSWQKNRKINERKNSAETDELQAVMDYIKGTLSYTNPRSFFFCQFPFLISLGVKISILEYEARRQMERKAEEAFINSLDKQIFVDVYFRVKVRREYIVQDSLRCIQLNSTNLKKSLRVLFIGEPGIDAGGLKKEWFLLLSKALFSPSTGMLMNVEDSNYLWFSVVALEKFEIYYLFGAILGLAIYNSTILDLKFPLAFYKILLGKSLNLMDYQNLYPVAASNLLQLRRFSPEELESLSLSFEVTYSDPFGVVHSSHLLPNGGDIPVTPDNLELYIEKYSMFFLIDGIKRQMDSFTLGFKNVIEGNGLSLFLPEEIQLLLCGSEEAKLEVDTLKSVTKYIGWKDADEAKASSLVQWLWEFIESLNTNMQKKFLLFVTGSDRVPATGIQNLNFRVKRIGKDCNRLPIAHTCFNELDLYNYSSKKKFYDKLYLAVNESSGFGIK